MAVLSRRSPNRWGNHAHDHGFQRANAPELTTGASETTPNTGDFAGGGAERVSLISARHGHPRRGSREVFLPQSTFVVCGSSCSRALALSLEDSASDETFQADLQRALQESQSQSTPPQHPPPTVATDTPAKPTSFLSERAQLEKERLARQKRLRGDADDRNSSRGPTPSTSTADSGSDDDELGRPAAKRQHLSTPRQDRTLQQSGSKQQATVISGPSKTGASANQLPMFWRGEIRQTANMHVDPKKDIKPTFRLSEIIGEVRLVLF